MAIPLRIYNTLGRRKQELRPLEPGRVTIYSCGPTVYRYAHVGNLRTYIFSDLLRRALGYLGLETRQVMNITDVGHLTEDDFDRGEDKMLVSARLENKPPEEIAEFYTAAFMDDIRKVNIQPADEYPRATTFVPEMQRIIATLIERGHAYQAGGNVYYDIASFPEYGQLSGNTIDKLLAGTRGEPDPRKRAPGDFTLWKAAGDKRLQVWESPWGRGFPGWHIECSAMSTSLLGERFDVHTGGADNVFPHHEAEIAQSEGAFGHRVVGCWVHGEHLLLSGARMAKSSGNFFRITEIEEMGHDPLAFRYLALQARYRAKLNFSVEGLAGADHALRQLRERIADWSRQPAADAAGRDTEIRQRFEAAVRDDLDLPAAMALVAEVGRAGLPGPVKAGLLLDFDRVLGLDLGRATSERELPEAAAALLAQRERARAARDFATSDRLREELAGLGVQVTDGPDGQRWKVVSSHL